MTLTQARLVADAVLYEGYLLYPYRASSAKNQVRWQFGILGPAGAAAAGVGEETSMSAEVLVEAAAQARVEVTLRFLQVQARVVQQYVDGGWSDVDELLVDGTRWIPFHEAVPREISLPAQALDGTTRILEVGAPSGEDVEELRWAGVLVGRLVRSRWAVAATVTVSTRAALDPRLLVLRLQVDNGSTWTADDVPGWAARDVAARYSLVGTHLLLEARGTAFVSLLEGPSWSDADATSCAQLRCWPVMITDDDGADAVLVSPIVLGDHPTIAPESAGDLFDATEIDEILTLRVRTMTAAEKAEARGTDPRAAAILARCDDMTDDAMTRLHGARRPASDAAQMDDVPVLSDADVDGDVPWWDAGQDARARPESDSVLVDDVAVSQGSRVLLRPSRRADAQDVFLAGQTAVVARVYFDVDGATHVAVTLEDDPGADLYDTTGRFYYFGPEELEPLPARSPAREDAP